MVWEKIVGRALIEVSNREFLHTYINIVNSSSFYVSHPLFEINMDDKLINKTGFCVNIIEINTLIGIFFIFHILFLT